MNSVSSNTPVSDEAEFNTMTKGGPRDEWLVPASVAKFIEQQKTILQSHAELTIKELERRLKRRGWTTGKKRWELDLLASAYKALGQHPPVGSVLDIKKFDHTP